MHRSLTRWASVLAVIAAVFAVTGAALAAPAHKTATVTVIATEFKFKLAPSTAKAGSVMFNILNKGKLSHDFTIGGKKSAMIAPGKSARLTVTLKAGKYPYSCTVPGHAAAGMKGTLTVK
jgi:uncharacterized cupredoxin-like copper-binding protein